jgi:catechol 2,3-dioxygenase-like lactoylglutathione lyase family enzyme
MWKPSQRSAPRRHFLHNPAALHLFHYHLVTSNVREVEARYLARLGFRLVARYGRIGDEQVHYEAGVAWEELERLGFRHRLSELERGAVNVVVQPGQWPLPRVDHLGVALDDDEFHDVLERATELRYRVQEYPGRRTFVATDAGYRVEVHPQRDWIDEVLANADELRLSELQLRADDPAAKAGALVRLLDAFGADDLVEVGDSVVRFLEGGPRGRPELYAEQFT